jgi:hypothetical protein
LNPQINGLGLEIFQKKTLVISQRFATKPPEMRLEKIRRPAIRIHRIYSKVLLF